LKQHSPDDTRQKSDLGFEKVKKEFDHNEIDFSKEGYAIN